MAVGFETLERLEKGLDRLEKFFKKKKVAPHSLVFHETKPSMISEGFTPTFPSPSFIRPTSSRMVAREEATLSGRIPPRAHSLPGPAGSPCLISLGQGVGATADAQTYANLGRPDVLQRASSLNARTKPPTSLPELLEFSFSVGPSKDSYDSSRPCRRSRSSSNAKSRCSSTSVSPGAPVLRKRSSLDDDASNCISPLSKHPQADPGFPEQSELHLLPPPSPRLVPLPPDEAENETEGDGPDGQSIDVLLPTTFSTNPGTTLKEPSLDDFLLLSDDDIADDEVDSQSRATVSILSSFPMPPKISRRPTASSRISDTSPFLTLSPPLASRPAAAAALRAAKLASKYQFDLVYIVNLWPKDMGCTQYRHSPHRSLTTTPSPPDSPTSSVGSAVSQPFGFSRRCGRLTGRLLAAYGLTSLMFPFRISEPVHQKVLRTDGWLEYRGDSDTDYFTRGYSCSFYTGHSPDKREYPIGSPDARPKRSRTIRAAANRGIVFAAYRRPPAAGACRQSDPAELEALYHDAEELVDMLIDIHMAHRRPSVAPQRCAGVGTGSPALARMPLITV
ncbi:hypothetical protein QBC42DRAFT_343749 [Cladorrhinum samala]|uniref:Uncharacterized protein n=1 Tax=Cladorrhinum samala TaxID=585594 RepID=A0AAV9HYY6_9PEZI|nr:hypothetical protein QBC42DRAFT_343749 [Cladorrhinum samala]